MVDKLCCLCGFKFMSSSSLILISLFTQGEHFGTTEATEAFFAMTRLFQSNDVRCPPIHLISN